MFGFFYYDWTILIVLPAMVFALWAQFRVKSTFDQFSTVMSRRGYTGAEAARRLLDSNGLHNVAIMPVDGHLSDHYDPRNKTLYLSPDVYGSRSTAAIGVACHEAGHAMQDAKDYGPLKLRMSIIPACNVGSKLAIPLFLIGILLASAAADPMVGDLFMLLGIAAFSLSTVFQLVTLPVEFNASRRAMKGMASCGILAGDELPGARKVLTAAAMTYVAALATSLLSLLRLIIIANNSRRR